MSSFTTWFSIVRSSFTLFQYISHFFLSELSCFTIFNVVYLKIMLFIWFPAFFALNYVTFAYPTFNFVRFSCCLLIFCVINTVFNVFAQIYSKLDLIFTGLCRLYHLKCSARKLKFFSPACNLGHNLLSRLFCMLRSSLYYV